MPPVVDRAAAQELNLAVLKRMDPEVDEVLATSGHVCLYHMSVDTQQWSRKNVEGSLFLLKRRTNPRFQMMVLNKMSTENYHETIHGGLDFEVNPPYLMYTVGNAEIHGIWFYEKDDLERIGALLSRIKHGLPRPDILPSAMQQQQSATQQHPAQPPQPTQAADEATVKDDGAFWDKQVAVPADGHVPLKPDMGRQQPTQQPAAAQQARQAPHQPAEAAQQAAPNPLQRLFKQATLKDAAQQQAQQAPGTSQPEPAPPMLSPAFFQAGAPPSSTTTPPPQQQHPHASNNAGTKLLAELRKGVTLSPNASMEIPRAAVTEAASAAAANPLSKLFAKAGAQAAAAQSTPPASQQQRPARQDGTTPSTGPPSSAQGEVREKVRAVLRRLAANDAFVDMLAQELSAVGLVAPTNNHR